MAVIRKLVLDVLKPHQPNAIDFSVALADLGADYRVNLMVAEMDEKTETTVITIEGNNISYDQVVAIIEKMGASIHSIDEVEIHSSEAL
ncbi:DUF211 domain-containing protein [Thiomicrorhabdus cannonii]|uniref:DUF211 domain-containing protein n=1 Tax=Thiomicrorhabdus cannonii TaxID=2748011 RepID=UPI0015BB33A4|nr:DUF211 domain-containing protein [Thiomicrorhabdus cannonii]